MTDNNTVGSGTGFTDDAADFEFANSEYLSRTDGDFVDWPTNKMTLAFLLNCESIDDNRAFFSKWNHGTSTTLLFEMDQTTGGGAGSGQLFIADTTADTGANRAELPGGVFVTGGWHLYHIVFDGTQTGDSNRLKLYKDGSAVTLSFVGAIPAALTNSTAQVEVGGCSSLSRFYDGLMDECILLGEYAMSSTEVSDHWNGGSVVPFADWAGGGGGVSVPALGLTGGLHQMSGGIA